MRRYNWRNYRSNNVDLTMKNILGVKWWIMIFSGMRGSHPAVDYEYFHVMIICY
jgi:hypothetical protein